MPLEREEWERLDSRFDQVNRGIEEIKITLAGNKARDEDRDRRISGHHMTLFGEDGRGGVVGDVNDVKTRERTLIAIVATLVPFVLAILEWAASGTWL